MTAVVDVDLGRIVAGGNDRTVFRADEIAELAASMQEHGLAQPITVRPVNADAAGYPAASLPDAEATGEVTTLYQIVAGERRTRAARLLGWSTIPALVRELDDETAAAVMLIENTHRVDLQPIDEARAYRSRMDRFGWSAAETARRAQVSPARVAARLVLLDLVDDVQQLIAAGQLEPRFGEVMAPLDPNRQRIALRYLIATEKPSMRELRLVCSELLAAQAQDALFDVFSLALRASEAPVRADVVEIGVPAAIIPPMRLTLGGVGVNLERYVADLLESDVEAHRDLAPIVGAIYAQLIRGNLARPPRRFDKRYAVA